MDHVFKYTNFGLVSLIHGDFFIRQVRNAAGVLYTRLLLLYALKLFSLLFSVPNQTVLCNVEKCIIQM